MINYCQGTAGILSHYKGELQTALIHLYPDIGLTLEGCKFIINNNNNNNLFLFLFYSLLLLIVKNWKYPATRKEFFIEFAKKHNFNPNLPSNWYSITKEMILEEQVLLLLLISDCFCNNIIIQDGKLVLGYYENNHVLALTSLFPKIGLLKENFSLRIVFLSFTIIFIVFYNPFFV